MSLLTGAVVVLVIWVAYRLGRSNAAHASYARGWMDGRNAQGQEHVNAQRENAAWQ